MKIENFKDLQKLIKVCQSQGVKAITVDGISLELSDTPVKTSTYKRMKQITEPSETFPPHSVDENIQIPQMDIPTDALSEEELLYYSSGIPSEAAQ